MERRCVEQLSRSALAAALASLLLLLPAAGRAQAPADVEGAHDHPAVRRYPGAYISQFQEKDLEQADIAVSGALTEHVEGRWFFAVYVYPARSSCLQIARSYEADFRKAGREVRTGTTVPSKAAIDVNGSGVERWVLGIAREGAGRTYAFVGCTESAYETPAGPVLVVETQGAGAAPPEPVVLGPLDGGAQAASGAGGTAVAVPPGEVLPGAAAAAGAGAGAQSASGSPAGGETWPQPLLLGPSEKASFGFAVGQPGAIQVDVRWQGGPLSVVLKDPAGKPVTATKARTGPSATLSYAASAAEVQRGLFWAVVVAPPPQAKGRWEGQLSVKHPPADAARVEQALAATPRPQAESAQVDPAATAHLDARLAAARKTLQDRLASIEGRLRAQLRPTPPAPPPAQPVPPPRDPPEPPEQPPPAPPVLAATTVKAPAAAAPAAPATPAFSGGSSVPAIFEVVPRKGAPGDSVTVRGTNLAPDKFVTEVFFTINPGMVVQAKVLSIAAAGGVVAIVVQVPNAAGVTQGFDGSVHVVATDRGASTQPLPFRFDPIAKPVVASVAPAEGRPEDWVLVAGSSFKAADQVHFRVGGRDLPAETRFVDAGRLQAKVPGYSAVDATAGSVYVAGTFPTAIVASNEVPFAFRSTQPCRLAAVAPSPAAIGDWVTFTGENFALKVTMFGSPLTVPCQIWIADAAGKRIEAKTQLVDATHLRAQIPAGVAPGAARATSVGGSLDLRIKGIVITSVSASEGEGGQAILLTGFGFGPPPAAPSTAAGGGNAQDRALATQSGTAAGASQGTTAGATDPQGHALATQGGSADAAGPGAGTGTGVAGASHDSPASGTGDGVLHFLVGGKDLAAWWWHWDDTQILAYVPVVPGVAIPTDGQLFVSGGGDESARLPFRYRPALEVTSIDVSSTIGGNYRIDSKGSPGVFFVQDVAKAHHRSDLLLGYRGDDEFFTGYGKLKNGWVVEDVAFYKSGDAVPGEGDAGLAEARIGTDSPYVRIHWWVEPVLAPIPSSRLIRYDFRIIVKGPKGLPCW